MICVSIAEETPAGCLACQAPGRETADGQIDHETLRTALRALAPDGRGA
jgi:hypothetical protein